MHIRTLPPRRLGKRSDNLRCLDVAGFRFESSQLIFRQVGAGIDIC